MTQLQLLWQAQRRSARINNAFLELLPTMTRGDLEKLIAIRPALWERFAGYLPKLPETRDAEKK